MAHRQVTDRRRVRHDGVPGDESRPWLARALAAFVVARTHLECESRAGTRQRVAAPAAQRAALLPAGPGRPPRRRVVSQRPACGRRRHRGHVAPVARRAHGPPEQRMGQRFSRQTRGRPGRPDTIDAQEHHASRRCRGGGTDHVAGHAWRNGWPGAARAPQLRGTDDQRHGSGELHRPGGMPPVPRVSDLRHAV